MTNYDLIQQTNPKFARYNNKYYSMFMVNDHTILAYIDEDIISKELTTIYDTIAEFIADIENPSDDIPTDEVENDNQTNDTTEDEPIVDDDQADDTIEDEPTIEDDPIDDEPTDPEPWEDVDEEEDPIIEEEPKFLFDIDLSLLDDISYMKNKDIDNMEYFIRKNKFADAQYSEDDLKNFYSTFFGIILDQSTFEDDYSNANNAIYSAVMNYYRNFQNDSTMTGISRILGSLYSYTTSDVMSSCGCTNTSATGSTTLTNSNCLSLYQEAMSTYLTQMLSDPQFYHDWFCTVIDEYTCEVNTDLIDNLESLIDALIEAGFSLDSDRGKYNCGCPQLFADSYTSDCNENAIKDFKKVLTYIRNNDIDTNINKIKIYGTKFAELLPKLVF